MKPNRNVGAGGLLRRGIACAVVATALVAAGCGGSASTAKGDFKTVSATAPSSGCGSYTLPPADDRDGVVAALDAKHRPAYGGLADTYKSAWTSFKPSGPPPYDVGISWSLLNNELNKSTVDSLVKRLKASPLIGTVTVRSNGSTLDVGQQLQQFNSLLASKPDILVLQTPSPPSFNGLVKKAAEQNVPTVTWTAAVDSPAAVNVLPDGIPAATQMASYVARAMGGKGNVLWVQALAGTPPDTLSVDAWKRVFKNCPDIKKIGTVYGGFADSLAKGETLKFLASHPQPINGAVQVGGMSAGVMRAFEQTGRTVPVVGDFGASRASLGFWRKNRKTYPNIATSTPPEAIGRALGEIGLRMLDGQGLKLNNVLAPQVVITDANLDDWSDPKWDLNTPGPSDQSAQSWASSDYLDDFFENSRTVK